MSIDNCQGCDKRLDTDFIEYQVDGTLLCDGCLDELESEQDAAQKEALLQRVQDVYSGATGAAWIEEEGFIDATALCRVMMALRDMFGTGTDDWRFGVHVLDSFETPDTATDFLYRQGVRV
jgi:hypothetical protein